MRDRGVEVVELHQVLAETLARPDGRAWLLDRRITANQVGIGLVTDTRAFLDDLAPQELARYLIGGMSTHDLPADLRPGYLALARESGGVTEYLLPPLHAGWAVRRKTNHFAAYEEVAKKFAKLLGMDPWLINPMYARCGEVNFSDGSGAECLMSNAETLLGKIRRKYKEYGIQEKPFIIVKADAGTYGMGIMTVRDPKDLADINRRTRNKMSVIKDGQDNAVVGKMKVSALLEAMPGVGKVRARQIMEEVGISESRRVRGLGNNQIAALLQRFADAT